MGFSAQLGELLGWVVWKEPSRVCSHFSPRRAPALGTVVTAGISEGTHFIMLSMCLLHLSFLFYFLILEICYLYASFQEQVHSHAETLGILKGENVFRYLPYPEALIQEANSLGMLNGKFINLAVFTVIQNCLPNCWA